MLEMRPVVYIGHRDRRRYHSEILSDRAHSVSDLSPTKLLYRHQPHDTDSCVVSEIPQIASLRPLRSGVDVQSLSQPSSTANNRAAFFAKKYIFFRSRVVCRKCILIKVKMSALCNQSRGINICYIYITNPYKYNYLIYTK